MFISRTSAFWLAVRGASVFALPGAGMKVMQKGLALTFTFVLIGCGGALSGGPSSSPSATPNQFVVSGNFTGLKCTSSSAPVEFLALDESATTISIKFEGPGANGAELVGMVNWRARSQNLSQLATQGIELDPVDLTSINITARGDGLPLIEGDTNSPWALRCKGSSAGYSAPPATPTGNSGNSTGSNSAVCSTIQKTVSGSLADAVSLYNSYSISLYQLGTIYSAWASGARGLNGSASGAVKERLSRLIKIADNTATSAQNGNESRAVDGIVSFADSLDGFFAACP